MKNIKDLIIEGLTLESKYKRKREKVEEIIKSADYSELFEKIDKITNELIEKNAAALHM